MAATGCLAPRVNMARKVELVNHYVEGGNLLCSLGLVLPLRVSCIAVQVATIVIYQEFYQCTYNKYNFKPNRDIVSYCGSVCLALRFHIHKFHIQVLVPKQFLFFNQRGTDINA